MVDNPVNAYYQPFYTQFHKVDLFTRGKSVTEESVSQANEVLTAMYNGESEELRNYRILSQKDGKVFYKNYSAVCELFARTNKYHRIFFLSQPELFAMVMGVNTYQVRVNYDPATGRFSLEYSPNSDPAPRKYRHVSNDGYTAVNPHRRRFNRHQQQPEKEKVNDLLESVTKLVDEKTCWGDVM